MPIFHNISTEEVHLQYRYRCACSAEDSHHQYDGHEFHTRGGGTCYVGTSVDVPFPGYTFARKF